MRIPEIKDTCVITGGEYKGRFGRVVARGIMMGQDAVSVQLRAEDGKPPEQIDIPVTGVKLQPDPKGPVSEATLDGKPVSEFSKEIRRASADAGVPDLPVGQVADPLPLPPLPTIPEETPAVMEHLRIGDEEFDVAEVPSELVPIFDLLDKGPATNKQLLKIEKKYHKRLDALREWLEEHAGKTIVSRPVASGVTEYRIIEF